MKQQILCQGYGFECRVPKGMKPEDPPVGNSRRHTSGGEKPFRTDYKFRLPLAPILFFDHHP